MKARIAIVSFIVVFLFFFTGSSHAFMHKVWFNAWTQTETGQPDKMGVYVEVIDDQLAHPPDFVKEIKITAPDGSIFYLDLSKDWRPWDHAFWRAFVASDFVGEVIPGGTYRATVTPDAGTAITESDSVAAGFLKPPVVTYPTAGMIGVTDTPTFTWNAVAGASHYRILLFNKDWSEPVYSTFTRAKHTDFRYYTVPPGDLKSNTNYWVQIEARAGSQDMDMRSRTTVHFTTGAW